MTTSATENTAPVVLKVDGLKTYFETRWGTVKAVDGVTFDLRRGETLGIVGESGSGKSVTMLSLMRLIPEPPGRIVDGQILLEGQDLVQLSDKEMSQIRGSQIALIIQDPMTSLNPVFSIGNQVGEAIKIHQDIPKSTVLQQVLNVLRKVNIPAAETRVRDYPHQMSGGMRQRVVGAIGISCEPIVLIADEPTTSLDVTIQAQYLKLLKELQEASDIGLIFITHDFGIVAKMCDRVAVMYAGRIVEMGDVRDIFNNPSHPYTEALLSSVPKLEANPATQTTNEVLLEAEGLKKYFPVTKGLLISKVTGWIKAVDGVSFQVRAGETLGIVGESGCGKSTTAKMLLMLEEPTEGTIRYQGQEIRNASSEQRRAYRSSVQAVFQDPWSSLNPRMRVRDLIAEPMVINLNLSRREMQDRVTKLLGDVGLSNYHANLYPHEFSGGQRQRLAIARALSVEPRVIVLDEPVSALDVSIRAQIMNLLKDLQEEYNVSYLLIAHHLATVRYMCDWVAVMYLGQIVEFGPTKELFQNASHPYTKALMNAALPSHPDIEQEEMILTGEVPSPLNPPEGCRFHPRCPFVMERCSRDIPEVTELAPGHVVSCHLY
ncbi:Glutathione import ATP-binding protein GsiA [Geodia barretti]|uniref:Glutathione import ATP-binding protein GsiA n=2 Tax=Geodia barretti TaxID=519541 RepID=A0AA35RK06_GEOBA|nr:Glutathione import ATP-binding protein GsiA [Geodia barretti]